MEKKKKKSVYLCFLLDVEYLFAEQYSLAICVAIAEDRGNKVEVQPCKTCSPTELKLQDGLPSHISKWKN